MAICENNNSHSVTFSNKTRIKTKYLEFIYKRFVDYLRQTVPGEYRIERILWILVRLLALLALSAAIHDTTKFYRTTQIATGLETDSYPVRYVDFPAVAVCNMNVISRSKAAQYAEELWRSDRVRAIANLTQSKILDILKYFGNLYTFSTRELNVGDVNLLHEILKEAHNGTYNLHQLAGRVTRNCEDYVERCRWNGVTRTCEDIVLPRWTPDGLCCTFNYARWSDKFLSDVKNTFEPPIEKSEISGSNYGLWLLLDTMEDDYYYQMLPSTGFKVLIYTSTDYPDAPSGGLREILVPRGTETFLDVRATVFDTAEDVIRIGEEHRKCLFKSELDVKFGGHYSFSDCIMDCRIRDIIEKCGCVPFFYPMPNDVGKMENCHLLDLPCLHRFKKRWWSLEPDFSETESELRTEDFSEITEGHLHCHCYPACSNVDYTVFRSSSNLADEMIYWDTVNNPVEKNKSHVVLNVFFGSYGTMKLKQDIQYYWYELMSNYGSHCSAFLGLSFMSGIEFIYKFICIIFTSRKQLQQVFVKVAPLKKNQKITESKALKAHIYHQEIYLGNFSDYLDDKLKK